MTQSEYFARYYITKDNVMVMASEVGVYDVDPAEVSQKGRLRPGRMLLVDTEKKTIIRDEEMKRSISEGRPHGKWWREHLTLRDFVSQALTTRYKNALSKPS